LSTAFPNGRDVRWCPVRIADIGDIRIFPFTRLVKSLLIGTSALVSSIPPQAANLVFMTEDRSDFLGHNPSPSTAESRERSDTGPAPPGDHQSMSFGDGATIALDMAQVWIKENQTTTMLGAFAAGVFVGALFRD